jgi:hypothetical protein
VTATHRPGPDKSASATLPEIIPAELIRDEAFPLLRDTGAQSLRPDSKIMLAIVMLADHEGVAYLTPEALRRWCAQPGKRRASQSFVNKRIRCLIDAGVLAPGSTATELRSMIGRRAEAEEVAA